jgi:mono/diheme cytochrome c family protein
VKRPGAGLAAVVALATVCEAVPRRPVDPGSPRATGDTHAKGKAAYGKACEACHGPEGNGKSQGPGLVPFTLELQELITIVRQGIGVMPGTPRDRVSDEEISAIRDYLVSLKN